MSKTIIGPIARYLAVFALLACGIDTQVHAQVFDQNRAINAADKQRMLNQKMSKEVLLVALGIDASGNLASLRRSHALFDRTLRALREGDANLGLKASESQDVQAGLDTVTSRWREMDPIIRGVLQSGQAAPERINAVVQVNPLLSKAMNEAVRAYSAEAATNDLNAALAMAINLSGRLRMLSQKMSKEYLLIAYGHETERNRKNLGKSIALFERALVGLTDGDAELRILPAPSEEIDQQLSQIRRLWEDFAPLVKNVADGSIATQNAITIVARENLMLLKEADAAVLMYERFARDQTSRLVPLPSDRDLGSPRLRELPEDNGGEQIAVLRP